MIKKKKKNQDRGNPGANFLVNNKLSILLDKQGHKISSRETE